MLSHITLHIARGPAHPEGSESDGYEITAPLDVEGRLDPKTWRDQRTHCLVRRFRPGEPTRQGRLVHRAGGSGGGTWVIDYDDRREDDDEIGFRLNTHVFRPGEYVSLTDEVGKLQTYLVTSVR